MTVAGEFTEGFRIEHQRVRDLLPELAGAFRDTDAGRVRSLKPNPDPPTWAATARDRRS